MMVTVQYRLATWTKKKKLLQKMPTERKKSETDMVLQRQRKVILTKPEYPQRDMSESSNLRMLLITT